jgi:hypothetical protein
MHPIFCDRCSKTLTWGQGNFYVVRIEAVADPTPPEISEADLKKDVAAEIERLFKDMESLSEQELLDQVFRRVTIYLCADCYPAWIENPAR